jgi:hypothetical protein
MRNRYLKSDSLARAEDRGEQLPIPKRQTHSRSEGGGAPSCKCSGWSPKTPPQMGERSKAIYADIRCTVAIQKTQQLPEWLLTTSTSDVSNSKCPCGSTEKQQATDAAVHVAVHA